MPIRAEIEGVGTLEFPDDTPQEVIDRRVRYHVNKQELEKTTKEGVMADAMLAAANRTESGIKRISVGGLADTAKAVASDMVTGGMISTDPMYSPTGPTMRATVANVMGEETPQDIQQNIQESGVKRGVVSAAGMVPAVGLGSVLGPPGMAMTMGAEAFGRNADKDIEEASVEALKQAGIGLVLPVAGKFIKTATGVATAAAANRGVMVAANPAVQKAVEIGAETAAIQGAFLAHLHNSDEYKNATPEERSRMDTEFVIQNAIFSVPGAVQTASGKSAASKFESPSVKLGRALGSDEVLSSADRLVPRKTQTGAPPGTELASGQIEIPPTTVLPGTSVTPGPVTEQALADAQSSIITPGKGDALRSLGEPPQIIQPSSSSRPNAPSGKVSFRAEAPELVSNVPDQTADALRRETTLAAAPASNEVVDQMADHLRKVQASRPTGIPGEE